MATNDAHYELPKYDWPEYCKVQYTDAKFCIFTINFRANPRNRSTEWIDTVRQPLGRKRFQQEYENDWSVSSGKPVYEDYDTTRHVAMDILLPQPNAPVYIGIDVGLYPGVVALQETTDGQIRVLRSVFGDSIELIKFGPNIIKMLIELNIDAGIPTYRHTVRQYTENLLMYRNQHGNVYDAVRKASIEALEGGLQFIFVADPAGQNRKSTDAGTDFKMLASYFGINVRPGIQDPMARWNAVTGWLVAPDLADGVPKFIISPHESTERLRTGFGGAYVWASNVETSGRELPEKNKFSHVQDALQYIATILNPIGNTGARGARDTQAANMGNSDYMDAVFGRGNPLGLPHGQHIEQMAARSIELAEKAGERYNENEQVNDIGYKLSVFSPPPKDADEEDDDSEPIPGWNRGGSSMRNRGYQSAANMVNPFAPRK